MGMWFWACWGGTKSGPHRSSRRGPGTSSELVNIAYCNIFCFVKLGFSPTLHLGNVVIAVLSPRKKTTTLRNALSKCSKNTTHANIRVSNVIAQLESTSKHNSQMSAVTHNYVFCTPPNLIYVFFACEKHTRSRKKGPQLCRVICTLKFVRTLLYGAPIRNQ